MSRYFWNDLGTSFLDYPSLFPFCKIFRASQVSRILINKFFRNELCISFPSYSNFISLCLERVEYLVSKWIWFSKQAGYFISKLFIFHLSGLQMFRTSRVTHFLTNKSFKTSWVPHFQIIQISSFTIAKCLERARLLVSKSTSLSKRAGFLISKLFRFYLSRL